MLFCREISFVAIYAFLVSNFELEKSDGVKKITNIRYDDAFSYQSLVCVCVCVGGSGYDEAPGWVLFPWGDPLTTSMVDKSDHIWNPLDWESFHL